MLENMLKEIGKRFETLTDVRKAGNNLKYKVKDAVLSAFSVFFMQSGSFLAHQRDMQRSKGRNNAMSLFGIHQIPSDNQIRNILDGIAPRELSECFWLVYEQSKGIKEMEQHVGIDGNILCALDGVEYFSSQAISCQQCSTRQHGESITYSHSVIAPVLVAPQHSYVLSLEPEFIQPQDGVEKQDCEQNAMKRWIQRHAHHLPVQRTTILTDDLHSRQPFCQLLLDHRLNFILVCLPESHPTLYEEIALLARNHLLDSWTERVWNGRFHEIHTYRYTTQLPLRTGPDALLVNWFELTMTHAKTGEQLYHNAFITNHVLSAQRLRPLAQAGRTRWKSENENHNTLKNLGYHLEHNFGHGQQHLAAFLLTLNLFAFLLHTILELTEPKVQAIRKALATRVTFFNDLRTLTRYFYFPSWHSLWDFMITQLELAASP
jgi:hypothetical protein